MKIKIDWPAEFIGKFVAVETVGTHGSYEIAINSLHGGLGVYCFNSEKEGIKNVPNGNFIRIDKNYPILEIEIKQFPK